MNLQRLGLLPGALLLVVTASSCRNAGAKRGEALAAGAPRLGGITHSSWRLGPISERKAPNHDALRYGVIIPFQAGPNMAAAFANRAVYTENWNYDFEDGNDLFLFDDVDTLQAQSPIPLNRSGVEPDPDFGGQPRYFNRYPLLGGFVPYGAKINGQAHPHAGTGFGISQTLTFPVAEDGTYSWDDSPINRVLEVFQFTYDGRTFEIASKETKTAASPLRVPDSTWVIQSGGICMAIPDGRDLLFPVWAGSSIDGSECSGVSRWSRVDGSWQVASFIPIAHSKPKEFNFYEPSLIRDVDGALIFAARDDGRQNLEHPSWGTAVKQDIRAWRSVDGGANWSQIIHAEMVRSGPMSIGRSADGIPFIVANPVLAGKPDDSIRELMYLWPLNGPRHALEEPMVVRDATQEFGRNPNAWWYVDHPNSTILRLADGRDRAFLAYRVRDSHVSTTIPNKGTPKPSDQAGSYLEEVISTGTPRPIWQF